MAIGPGSYVALVTPFLANGEVDYSSLERLIEWHVQANTTGLVVLGTTGEAATLSASERREILRCVVSVAAGRLPVIAGSGTNATQSTIEQTKAVAALGADAALVVTPYYNKPTQAGLVAHYEAVANTAPLPLLIYNVPGRTQCDCLPETVQALASHPNIIGIKEATGEVARLAEIQALVADPDFLCLSGDDATTVAFMQHGGHGTISVTANVFPEHMRHMVQAALSRNWDKAKGIQESLMPVHHALFVESNPIPVKWALMHQGKIPADTLRLPLTALSVAHHNSLSAALAAIGEHDYEKVYDPLAAHTAQ